MASRYWRCCYPVWIDGALDGVHMMPSRQFLVHQSVLNALFEWYPATIRASGLKYAAQRMEKLMCDTFHEATVFKLDVGSAFRKLTERNWEPMA